MGANFGERRKYAYQSFQSFAAGGRDSGVNATLTQNGYVGTYIKLTQPGMVTFTVKASGAASNGMNPDMTLSIADYSQSFNVNSTTQTNYMFTTPTLPAGMYFVRTQLDNSGMQIIDSTPTSVTPTLTVGNLSINSTNNVATVVNTASDANALSAANNYISNFRQGTATVATGFTSESSVQVSMVRNAFNFGGTVSGSTVGDNKGMLLWRDDTINLLRFIIESLQTFFQESRNFKKKL